LYGWQAYGVWALTSPEQPSPCQFTLADAVIVVVPELFDSVIPEPEAKFRRFWFVLLMPLVCSVTVAISEKSSPPGSDVGIIVATFSGLLAAVVI
jgi:hypothetical protein